jgi:mannose-1-phosphate guanylyltransferase
VRFEGRTIATEAVILCGGFATRLRGVVDDRPKALVEVLGRPFVEWLVRSLVSFGGIDHIVLATGHMGDMIERQLGEGSTVGARLSYSRESTPLGTGGATRLAAALTSAPQILVLNGDTYCRFDLSRLVDAQLHNAAAASIWLTEVNDSVRFGTVSMGADGRIRAFREKASLRGPQLVNAGVYLIDRAAILNVPTDRSVSLEREVFPSLVERGIYGVVGTTPFVDIGTPESLANADQALAAELAN